MSRKKIRGRKLLFIILASFFGLSLIFLYFLITKRPSVVNDMGLTKTSQPKLTIEDVKAENRIIVWKDEIKGLFIVLDLPSPFKIISAEESYVADISYNGSVFHFVGDNSMMGGWAGEPEKDEPSYTDEKLGNIETLRIWRSKNGVILINPIGISIGGYEVNSTLITKLKPGTYFTNSEVEAWKKVLLNLKLLGK